MRTLFPGDSQLFDPVVFEQALQAAPSPLAVFRDTLKHGNLYLKERFLLYHSAAEGVGQRAWLVDQVLLKAWRRYPWPERDKVALVAVGGYGRHELHMASDIDLMILYDETLDAVTQRYLEEFVVFLWDIGLEVGHSVRNLAECGEAAEDLTVITNLMEARLLCGPRSLFRAMQETIAPEQIWPSEAFFEAKLEEQRRRYAKYHDTAYNLEPNIKDGPGGLRDLQMISWVAQRHFGVHNLRALVYHGFLSEEEFSALSSAQEFLWRIRCLLHSIAKRKEDRLGFDYQRTIAQILGYNDDAERLGVEKFMKQYYRSAREILTLNEILLQLFREAIFHQEPKRICPLNRRFQICNDYIEVTHDKVFLYYPFALLEVFLLLQQHPESKGIRAGTGRMLRYYRYLIDKAFHQDLRARSLFFEIVRQPRGQTRAFRQMNRYGILGAYIPAFGQIIGQMQYDLFHIYTVDQHILFVLRNLRRFALPQFNGEYPLCSEIMQNLPKRELLYLAALFHDIAKGRGGDHSELGEGEALDFCKAHGLSDRDSRLVAWLVRHHLNMSMTAQRKDTSDPLVIKQFAQKVIDLEHLDYLYLLTVADIRGTNQTLWNSWKDALLADLYRKTRYFLKNGLEAPVDKRLQVEAAQSQALALLTGRAPENIHAVWGRIDENYFLRASPADIARETRLILDSGGMQPMVLIREAAPGSTDFLIFAKNKAFLFADTTYYLEQQHVSVVNASITNMGNGYLLLNYSVLDEGGEPLDDAVRAEYIRQGLLEAAMRHKPYACAINRRLARQVRYFKVPTRITFNNDVADNHTVMEVVTTDRPGVLSRIAQALLACAVQIKNAKIATLGSRVEDIFYIVDQNNAALHHPDQFDCLQEQLSELLENSLEDPHIMTF